MLITYSLLITLIELLSLGFYLKYKEEMTMTKIIATLLFIACAAGVIWFFGASILLAIGIK